MNLFIGNIVLAVDLARRELEAKYKRSMLGWTWILLTPLCLLGIYSWVFGRVIGIEWTSPNDVASGNVGYTLPFFVGLAIYLLISDVVNSSTTLFVSKRTYVIKSPFPLWVLWLANLMRAAVHGTITLSLVTALALYQQRLTFLGFVWMLLPLFNIIVATSALSLLLSVLGPFIGDISEAVRLLMRVLFYATPITYPLSYIKSPVREWMWLNPLTCLIEPLRSTIVFGISSPLDKVITFTVFSLLLFALSVWIFKRVKGVISDVV